MLPGPYTEDVVDSELQILARYGQNDFVIALGRRNYLLARADYGGERAAPMYSLIGTAKLTELKTEDYLRYILERIADHPINRIEELLPWDCAVAMAASSRIRRSATASAGRRRSIASVFLPSCATAAPASGLTVPNMIWPPESITAAM
jgi:hypothetical protein